MKTLLQPGPGPNLLYLWVGLAVIVGILIGYLIFSTIRKNQDEKLKRTAENIIDQAKEIAKSTELDAKDAALKITQQAESDIQHSRNELNKEGDRLSKRREELDHRFDQMQQRESALNKRQSAVDKRANEIEALYTERFAELQRVSAMSSDEARGILLEEVEKEARGDMARIIRQYEIEAAETGMEKARELIADAIQRVASDKVAEVTTSWSLCPTKK